MRAHSRSVRGATSLPRRVSITLRDRAGDRIDCVGGVLWITQDGDPRDITLTEGQAFTLDRPGAAIVHALADARFVVRRARPGAWSQARSALGHAARAVWRAASAPAARRSPA